MNATPNQMVVSGWRTVQRNSLRGFASVIHPSGMEIHSIAVHEKGGTFWASPPSRPMVAKDGSPLRDDKERPRYENLITFKSKTLRDKWSELVIEALLAAHPGALG